MMQIVNTPWGSWQVLYEDSECKVKRIVVNPNQRLSYQTHQRRSEVWIFTHGIGTTTIDGAITRHSPGDVVHIPSPTLLVAGSEP